jgi:hypothetical protein
LGLSGAWRARFPEWSSYEPHPFSFSLRGRTSTLLKSSIALLIRSSDVLAAGARDQDP